MPPPNATLQQLIDYLRDKATRYNAIVAENIEHAEKWRRGTDQFRPNERLASLYEAAAKDALARAQNYAGYALWFSQLRPLDQLAPGEETLVPATFLRRASAEDFPGQAFVRIAGVTEPVRLPMQSATQA